MEYNSLNAEAVNIESAISSYFGVDVSEVRGKKRKSAVVKSRHFSIYFLHTMFGFSAGQLGLLYGMSRHWVFDICRQMRDYCRIDARYRKELTELKAILTSDSEE